MAIKVNQFVEAGEKFEYKATKALGYHEVVVSGSLVGVTTKAAEINEVISCDAVGVYALAKKSGDVVAQGAAIYVSATGEATVTASGNTKAGIAWAAAAAGDATVLVKLNA